MPVRRTFLAFAIVALTLIAILAMGVFWLPDSAAAVGA